MSSFFTLQEITRFLVSVRKIISASYIKFVVICVLVTCLLAFIIIWLIVNLEKDSSECWRNVVILKLFTEINPKGSSYLIMAIVGGALIPPLMGLISDASQIQFAYLVPALCYLYLLYYGWSGYKQRG